jgi:hypothetical protein
VAHLKTLSYKIVAEANEMLCCLNLPFSCAMFYDAMLCAGLF